MIVIIELVALLFAALTTGGLLVNWIGLGRAMTRLSPSTYTEFHQATNETFDPYMPIVVFGAIMSGLVLVSISPGIGSISGELAVFGVICYLAVLLVSLTKNVPINRQVELWSSDRPPDNWSAVRERWFRLHIVRTLISVPALAVYILSCLLSR